MYGVRANGNNHGVVITKAAVVDSMLDRVGYNPDTDLSNIKVVEPAAGDGAFAIPILDRLYRSSIRFGFSFQKALANVVLFEIDAEMASYLTDAVSEWLIAHSEALPEGMIRQEDFLLSNAGKCDLVVGNPPYVRHENIPEEMKRSYRSVFSTFTHRSDLYIAFYEKGLSLLSEGGSLSFICSNRWLRNQYGKALREHIGQFFAMEEIIDLEEACPFKENVIAYPAITTIRKSSERGDTRYIQVEDVGKLALIDMDERDVRVLDISHSHSWFTYHPKDADSNRFLDSIENQGFRIGIGVATGADRIFIRKDFKSVVEDELLLPIVTSRDLRNNQLHWEGNFVLNPFDRSGKLIDLTRFPKAYAYLSSHRAVLDKRHVAKKHPAFWYKTIDRIKSALTNESKILLPDISGNDFIFIDEGNYYPHHNLYYITGNSHRNLVILAAMLMSEFVMEQLLDLGTRMNGGYPRWQSQNLRKLRIPVINAMPHEVSESLVRAYHERDYSTINELVNEHGLGDYEYQSGQLKLCESRTEYLPKG